MSDSVNSMSVRLQAIGTYIPDQRIENQPLLADFNLGTAFLEEKLGIFRRAIKRQSESTSDMCLSAFKDLCAQVILQLDELQLLIVVTQNPDMRIPHTAAILHNKLGLAKNCMTFDLSQGCAGYTHGLTAANALMDSLGISSALLFTCDPYSAIVNPKDRNTSLIFGDAATVTYLRRQHSGFRLRGTTFGTLPESYDCLSCDSELAMNGQAVLRNAVREVPLSIFALLSEHKLSTQDINTFLLHPGSLYVRNLLAEALQLDLSQAPFVIGDYGNTVSSSLPLMLKPFLLENNKSRLVLSGFGVGFSWASCLIDSLNED